MTQIKTKRYLTLEDMVRDFRLMSLSVNKMFESLSKYSSLYYDKSKFTLKDIDKIVQHIKELDNIRTYLFAFDSMLEQLVDFPEPTQQKKKLQNNLSVYSKLISKKLDMDLHLITSVLPNYYNINLPITPSNIYITCCPNFVYKVYVYADKGISVVYKTSLFRQSKRKYYTKVVDNLLWLPTEYETQDFIEVVDPTTALIQDLTVRKILKPNSTGKFSPYIIDSSLYIPLTNSLTSAKTKAGKIKKLLGEDFNSVSKLSIIKNKGLYWIKLQVEAIISEKTQNLISQKLGIDYNIIAKWSQQIEDNL